jgi:hypothetical protein
MGLFRIFVSATTLCLLPPSNPSLTNARHTTKTPGKDRLARMANQHRPIQPMQQVLPATSPTHTTPSPNARSTITSLDGAMDARMAVRNVWCATIYQTSLPITARTAQSSRKLGLNSSNGHQLAAGMQQLESAKKLPLQPCQPQHRQLWVSRPVMGGLPQHPGPSQPSLNRKAMIRTKNLTMRESMKGRCMPLVALTLTPTFPCIHVLITFLLTTQVPTSLLLPPAAATLRPSTPEAFAQFTSQNTS